MRQQKLHLVRQNPPITQNKVFPQRGHIRRVEQGHVGLLWGAVAFAVVAGATGGDHVHPDVNAVLGKRNDVLTREVFLNEVVAAVGAHIAVTKEKLAVGQAGLELKRVDFGHALGADDAVDRDDRLLACDGVGAAMENCNLAARFPANIAGCVVDHRLFERNPRLWEPLR